MKQNDKELFKQALTEGVNRRIDKTIEEEKQIEEIARIICKSTSNEGNCGKCGFNKQCSKFKDATNLYNAGYRKQSVGEWEQYGLRNPQCSLCHKYNIEKSNYCSHCGAKMKGGE